MGTGDRVAAGNGGKPLMPRALYVTAFTLLGAVCAAWTLLPERWTANPAAASSPAEVLRGEPESLRGTVDVALISPTSASSARVLRTHARESRSAGAYGTASTQNERLAPARKQSRHVQALGLTQGSSFVGVNDLADPSDGALAVGPNHVLELVNTAIGVFARSGVLSRRWNAEDFFALPETARLTDPRAVYDAVRNRFFLAMIGVNPSTDRSTLYTAISRTPDPTGEYCHYSADVSGVDGVGGLAKADFPAIGIDDHAIYLTLVRFPPGVSRGPADVVDTMLRMYPLATLASCPSSFVVETLTTKRTFPDGSLAAVMQPAITYGAPGVQYLVATQSNGGSWAGLLRITNPRTNPALEALTPILIDAYRAPPDVAQPASRFLLDLGSSRIPASAVYRSGSLWFAFTAANNAGTLPAARWYELDPAARAVRQRGAVTFTSYGYAFPAITVDADGNMAMVMAAVGPGTPPSAVVTSRARSDPPGHVGEVETFGEGRSAYESDGTINPVPWGDYYGIALDPDGRRIWAQGTYASSTRTWSTAIASFVVTSGGSTTPATPAPARTATPPPPTPVLASPSPGGPAAGVAQTLYLPNVTKMLGGPAGWQTPFIVQNVGQEVTDLEISFYRFSDGSLVTQRVVKALAPGTSFAEVPNNDPALPRDAQFSVVVRSTRSPIVAVVNEHQGAGPRAESGSYVGLAGGSTSVFLPYVAKSAGSWVSPFIVQNLGSAVANVTAHFISLDGTRSATLTRVIAPGRSAVVDPSVEPALITGVEYAVRVASDRPVGVVVNVHSDAPSIAAPRMFSYNGVPATDSVTVYLPYVARSAGGKTSRLFVQNMGTVEATPQLTFRRLTAGAHVTVTAPASVRPGASWSFDLGRTVTGTGCPAEGAANCVVEGEHAAVITGGRFAVLNAVMGPATAMGFTGSSAGASRVFLPNVTRTLGGPLGWTTPIVLQSAGATSATLRWHRFADAALVLTQPVSGLSTGVSVRIDPRTLALADDTQYAVVVEAVGAVHAVVTELNFEGGDGDMAYEGFAATAAPAAPTTPTPAPVLPPQPTPTPSPTVGTYSPVTYSDGWRLTLVRVEEQAPTSYDLPRPGMRFVAVFVRFDNGTLTVRRYGTFDFRLRDGRGVRHSPQIFFFGRNDLLVSGELAPGGFVAGSLVFEVPVGDLALRLIYDEGIRYTQASFTLFAGVAAPPAPPSRYAPVVYADGWRLSVLRLEDNAAGPYAPPSAGMRYVGVMVRFDNTSATTHRVSIFDFALRDGVGVRRLPRLFVDRTDEFDSGNIVPGDFLAGMLIFEAPIDDTNLELIYEGGISHSQATIRLY